ncbi:hypothetical protein E5673_12885 [Sphingomonas sp. PAMC26645]|uniref:hypothetical protein n=1 Tax=Sphingomonas sp. PAMC26645 TaxID=2565555 RepID=UPI00109E3657|nr:hypothetical protein [Sphingomonas sp. PAMC26645]QCB43003.1 hypothetical protein E5673_12885 [Sphingomonas sp. PAMC26645]
MAETLRPDEVEVTAFEGRVLVEAPGLVVTVDVEAASLLSDRLLAACGSARLQQHASIDRASGSGSSPQDPFAEKLDALCNVEMLDKLA